MNTKVRVIDKCPAGHELADDLLRRQDGTFMDDELYCEPCDRLFPMSAQAQVVTDIRPGDYGAFTTMEPARPSAKKEADQ